MSQIPVEWVMLALGTALVVVALVWHGMLLRKAKKEIGGEEVSILAIEGTVVMKYICFPRGDDKSPVLRVPEHRREEVRKTGECELMIQISCVDGYGFAEWVSPRIFDEVMEGSKVTVTYALHERTKERTRIHIKRHA